MRGKIFDDFMMFIGYYLPIFIIILAGVIFILTSIFKPYHINNPAQYSISIQNQNNQNNQSNLNTINSTVMVDIYYQNGYNVYYVPSFIENLSSNNCNIYPSNCNIFYNITNTYSNISDNNIFAITPPNITNINSTSFNINSLSNVQLESIINLSNNTFEGNDVAYTYQGNTYECNILGNNDIKYQAGDFIYFCILCKTTSNQNIGYYYLNESEYLNITPAISLLDSSQYSFPNLEYYNYTVDNVEIVNGTYLAIPLSNNGGYSMEDFQNILVTIGPPLSNYINTTPYYGDNVVFLFDYDGKYYALPSWYAGENNGNYYFFINLLNIPSLYNNNNFGCNIISIFVGFSNESLLSYLNGTIGGAPEALDPNDPYYAVMYDNGLNVFPIYVNFYSYNGNIEEQKINCNNNRFNVCFSNMQFNNVLPPYNNVTIYVNGTGITPNVETNGPFEGLSMDDGTNQGSYALITSNVLQNTLTSNQLSQSQNGLGLQTFAYFSGIPWEDPPTTGTNPEVSDAVVLSYVSYNGNGPFPADTINYYNSQDSKTNKIYHGNFDEYSPIGNQNIGISIGGNTYLPLNFPIFMYEYGWTSGGPGAGYSSGYYVGILKEIDILGLGYFLTTQYTNNPNPGPRGYYDYYYSGSANGGSDYYFLEDTDGTSKGYSGSYCSNDNQFCDIFAPTDQQLNQPLNQPYSQYGIFWLYNWFQEENNNNMNIFFLMNGNIFNYSLASEQYNWECGCVFLICFTCSAYAIPPNPPASTINGEPIFAQSYINAYNTAFNQSTPGFSGNYQVALNRYSTFTYSNVNSNFGFGTFGYNEQYNDQSGNSVTIGPLEDNASVYNGNPYLFISAGSGGGAGFMYLDWVIVTYGVPYVVSVS